MDEEFEFRAKVDAPRLKKKPSEYVQDTNIFVACEPEERLLSEAIRIIGVNSIDFRTLVGHENLNQLKCLTFIPVMTTLEQPMFL